MEKHRKLVMRVLYKGKDDFIRFPVDDYRIDHNVISYEIDSRWMNIDKSLVAEWGVSLNERNWWE